MPPVAPHPPTVASDLPWPRGPVANPAARFDEVAPVVVAFVRQRMANAHGQWYRHPTGPWALFGAGCSAGGTPFNVGWIDLIDVPVLPIDEAAQDVAGPTPRTQGAYQRVTLGRGMGRTFPADLAQALVLVLRHDRAWLNQRRTELQSPWKEDHAVALAASHTDRQRAAAFLASCDDRVAYIDHHLAALQPVVEPTRDRASSPRPAGGAGRRA